VVRARVRGRLTIRTGRRLKSAAVFSFISIPCDQSGSKGVARSALPEGHGRRNPGGAGAAGDLATEDVTGAGDLLGIIHAQHLGWPIWPVAVIGLLEFDAMSRGSMSGRSIRASTAYFRRHGNGVTADMNADDFDSAQRWRSPSLDLARRWIVPDYCGECSAAYVCRDVKALGVIADHAVGVENRGKLAHAIFHPADPVAGMLSTVRL